MFGLGNRSQRGVLNTEDTYISHNFADIRLTGSIRSRYWDWRAIVGSNLLLSALAILEAVVREKSLKASFCHAVYLAVKHRCY